MKDTRFLLFILLFVKSVVFNLVLAKDEVITTDSRIRTYIYNKNDIFKIVIHHNYQTSIEFEDGEEIENISTGYSYAWQITASKNRMFIKPLEDSIRTNMTVITNKRTYHFDVQSKPYTNSFDDELIYVVRFHVPNKEDVNPKASNDKNINNEIFSDFHLYNFNYEIQGKNNIKPVNIYDDAINTYLRFSKNINLKELQVKVLGKDEKKMVKINPKIAGDYFIISSVSKKIIIKSKEGDITIINKNF